MAYALPDILLFILILALLWFALYSLARWFVRRRERRESQELIKQIENGLNKKSRKGE